MKKFSILAMLAMGLCFFTACEDDNDSNPIIQQPTTFVLNEPAYASSNIDLESSKEIRLTCSQPDYGYTAAVTYQVQLSLSNSFTVSVAEATAAEEAGETLVADYITLDNSYTNCQIAADAAVFAKALVQLAKWTEDAVPNVQTVNVRLWATVNNYSIASNVINLNVVPYYIELKDALPEMWFILGSGATGGWDNGWDKIGTAMVPMSVVKDYDYDKKTGQGELTFTGYFGSDGFKIVKTPGSWDDQWGSSDGTENSLILKDGGDIKPAAGYYKLTMDTKKSTLKMEKVDITPATYTTIGLIGLNGDWDNDIVMTQFAATVNPHLWSTNIEVAADTEAKFRANAAWDTNWGATEFPYGVGANGGANIPVPAGKYTVVFNDIDGSYQFITLP